MLHKDADRRKADIAAMAKLTEEKGYKKTAAAILSFANILDQNQVPPDFLKRLDSLYALFEQEFIANMPEGQDFRKRCFEEIKKTVFAAIGRMHPIFSQAILVTFPFLQKLNHAKSITGFLADELSKQTIKDKRVVLHLYCYAYLITVEGVFDELARMLYFLTVVSKDNIPSVQDLEKMEVWDILKKSTTTPVFLERWDEKKHVRNAIGHTRIYYDSAKDEVRFVDVEPKSGKTTYDKIMKLSEFMKMALELEDSVEAFIYTIMMLRIYDFILSPNPYQ